MTTIILLWYIGYNNYTSSDSPSASVADRLERRKVTIVKKASFIVLKNNTKNKNHNKIKD